MKIKFTGLCIGLAAMSAAAGASAGGMPVYDGVHTIQNIYTQLYNGSLNTAEFGKQAVRWAQQNEHNLAQLQHIARQLVGLQRFTNVRQDRLPQLIERNPIDGVDGQCPGNGGGIAGYLASTIQVRADVSLSQQQNDICRQIAIARNLQFNNSVRLLQRLKFRGTQLEQIERARVTVGDRPGELSANGNDVDRFMAATGTDMDEWQSVNDAYERYVQILRSYSAGLSRQALQGKNKVIGSFVQATALKAALQNAKR